MATITSCPISKRTTRMARKCLLHFLSYKNSKHELYLVFGIIRSVCNRKLVVKTLPNLCLANKKQIFFLKQYFIVLHFFTTLLHCTDPISTNRPSKRKTADINAFYLKVYLKTAFLRLWDLTSFQNNLKPFMLFLLFS